MEAAHFLHLKRDDIFEKSCSKIFCDILYRETENSITLTSPITYPRLLLVIANTPNRDWIIITILQYFWNQTHIAQSSSRWSLQKCSAFLGISAAFSEWTAPRTHFSCTHPTVCPPLPLLCRRCVFGHAHHLFLTVQTNIKCYQRSQKPVNKQTLTRAHHIYDTHSHRFVIALNGRRNFRFLIFRVHDRRTVRHQHQMINKHSGWFWLPARKTMTKCIQNKYHQQHEEKWNASRRICIYSLAGPFWRHDKWLINWMQTTEQYK